MSAQPVIECLAFDWCGRAVLVPAGGIDGILLGQSVEAVPRPRRHVAGIIMQESGCLPVVVPGGVDSDRGRDPIAFVVLGGERAVALPATRLDGIARVPLESIRALSADELPAAAPGVSGIAEFDDLPREALSPAALCASIWGPGTYGPRRIPSHAAPRAGYPPAPPPESGVSSHD